MTDSLPAKEKEKEKRTRKRKSYSCVQCRAKKKQCNRVVPGCSKCVARGEGDQCRWGDERDDKEQAVLQRRRIEETSPKWRSNESQADTSTSPTSQADETKSLFETLSRADVDMPVDIAHQAATNVSGTSASYSSSKSIFGEAAPPSSRTSNASHSAYFPKTTIVTCTQARHLVESYQEQASRITSWLDTNAVYDALHQAKSDDISEIRHSKPDLFALISILCASSLVILPSTYTICMGLIGQSSELGSLLDRLEADASSALDQMNMFSHPTLIGLQALTVYQFNLSPRAGEKRHIGRMDEVIRSCRRMGLDKLGSAQDDEKLWLEEDLRQGQTPAALPTSFSGLWAGETFLKRNKVERSRGRAIWCFAVAKDWVSSRISGSCGIDPHSFTTTQPTAYSFGDVIVPSENAVIWSFMMATARNTYNYFNVCCKAQALGRIVDYDKILELDSELMGELERRPDWLRAESDASLGKLGADWRSIEAILVSSTLWNRMFALHRPFLALGRSEPEKYGLSSSRTFEYAMLCIRIMREGLQNGVLMLKQLTFHFRLLQAALVVITHLFLGYDGISMKETIAIHQDLNFAITTFKQLSNIDHGGFFHSQGERLEVLLAKAARVARQRAPCRKFSDESRLPSSMSSSQTQEAPFQGDEILSTLDEQLLRLSQAWPIVNEDYDNNQIWSDIFLMLDDNNSGQV